jgi:ATP-dependent Clp protease protease subunit
MRTHESREHWEAVNCLHEHNINPSTRELFIGGFPPNLGDEEIGVDHQMALEVIRNLTYLESLSDEEILIHMCTIGGDVRYGMAIYDAIHECSCPITIRAHAHARSMSSIILQAGDLRQLMPNAHFMIHEGSMYIHDTARGARSYIDVSRREEDRMMEIYTERSNVPHAQIEEQMKNHQEWYLLADEAVELGFADEVYSR